MARPATDCVLSCRRLTTGNVAVAEIQIDESLNVFDEPLLPCSEDPVTGFFRDGCCNTNDQDLGSHTVCVQVTEEFLQYSRFAGNDLSTPMPEFGFPGLKPGDRWCLCAPRWLEAYERKMAPKVFLTRTHRRALEVIPLEVLRQYAVDLN
jgi:uncharacterized protein (DUF2237 family)